MKNHCESRNYSIVLYVNDIPPFQAGCSFLKGLSKYLIEEAGQSDTGL